MSQLGFIGTGKISSAVVRGFLRPKNQSSTIKSVFVSPRNNKKAAALKSSFPNHLVIAQDNQGVCDNSQFVFLGLLPTVAKQVLPTLHFRQDHIVISMMASQTIQDLSEMLPGIPPENIVRTVPLPCNSIGIGPILMYPNHKEIRQLLQQIGTPLTCPNEQEMAPLVTLAGLISPFYAFEATAHSFAVSQGVREDLAGRYVGELFSGLALASKEFTKPGHFQELSEEAATAGGLNAMALDQMTTQGAYDIMYNACCDVYTQKLNGKIREEKEDEVVAI